MSQAVSMVNWFLTGRKNKKLKKFTTLKKRYVKEEGLTLDYLVEEAELALNALSTKEDDKFGDHHNMYALNYKEWADLRLFGPYIPPLSSLANCKEINMSLGLPDFTFIGFPQSHKKKKVKKDKEEWSSYTFFEVRRLSQLPIRKLPTVPGVPYELGVLTKFKSGLRGIRRFYTICEKGLVHPVRSESYKEIPLKGNHKKNGNTFIPTKQFESEEFRFDGGASGAEAIALAVGFYQQIEFNWYLRISDSRGVVNFSVTPEEAKVLFKDRVKAEVTKTGRRKTIIHWVSSHFRKSGAAIKTHLRGATQFRWRDYDVQVLLPGKHQSLITQLQSVVEDFYVELPWYARWFEKAYIKKKEREHQTLLAKEDTLEVVNPYTKEKFDVVGVVEKLSSLNKTVVH